MQILPYTPQPKEANDSWRAVGYAAHSNNHHSTGHPAPTDHNHMVRSNVARPILIVEDDLGLSTMLTLALEDARYIVEVAANGADALVRLKATRPRLILLDLRMPIMDGPAFLQEIFDNGTAFTPLPPIVIMTAYGDIDPEVSKLGLPAIIKPMKIDMLLQIIEQYAEDE
jgi:DNA-binding NtrC family response regulator